MGKPLAVLELIYRRMVPVLVNAGLCGVAIDLVDFGRSDRPARPQDYSYQAHETPEFRPAIVDGVTIAGPLVHRGR